MWLLMGERLKTQDKLKPWDMRANPALKCLLCNDCMDSHAHLFFECAYSTNVWNKVLRNTHLSLVSNEWKRCRDLLTPVAGRISARVVVTKLCYSATVYHIWQERNTRVFKGSPKIEPQLYEMIRSIVRLKLMSIRFKPSSFVNQLKADWQYASSRDAIQNLFMGSHVGRDDG
ncbi:uncharacterized protein [Rutidosis leptorrhynchoides]|uniref:uncharacterized protein n=1 Tax=Rutidosis leptorrhynchoides TaxID=125765 RepID=UPI003A9A6366